MMRLLSPLVLFLAVVGVCSAHVCVTSPRQRGDENVSHPGDSTCFRHGAPCGGVPPGEVKTAITSSEFEVEFTEAYNHYQVGNPGYLDVAWAPGKEPADGDFVTLAVVDDVNPRFQGTLRNLTARVTFPAGLDLANAVVRTRYVPHKTGEAVFYQCSDVSINTESSAAPPAASEDAPAARASRGVEDTSVSGKVVGLVQAGDEVQVWSIEPLTGAVAAVATLPHGGLRAERGATANSSFFLEDIVATDGVNVFYVSSEEGGLDGVANRLWSFDLSQGVNFSVPLRGPGFLFALDYCLTHQKLVGAFVAPTPGKAGYFTTTVASIDPSSGSVEVIVELAPDNTYINFQWSDKYGNGALAYLFQNENDALNMTSVMVIVNVEGAVYWVTKLDVSDYTYEDFSYFGAGITVRSPGLGPLRPDRKVSWQVAVVDGNTGTASNRGSVDIENVPHPLAGVYTGAIKSATQRYTADYTIVYRLFTLDDDPSDVVLAAMYSSSDTSALYKTTYVTAKSGPPLASWRNLLYVAKID